MFFICCDGLLTTRRYRSPLTLFYTHIYLSIYTYIYIYKYAYTYTHKYICTYMYIYIHTYTFTSIDIYIYMYTGGLTSNGVWCRRAYAPTMWGYFYFSFELVEARDFNEGLIASGHPAQRTCPNNSWGCFCELKDFWWGRKVPEGARDGYDDFDSRHINHFSQINRLSSRAW